jgi:metal-responsive CopG/Arc/MetJ family transcriptional regulator
MNTHGGAARVVLAARISHSLRDEIDRAAARAATTRSEYIRTALKLIITAEQACRPEQLT